MNKWLSVFKALIQTEGNIVPLFVHNEKSQTIAGIILASEAAVASIIEAVTKQGTDPNLPSQGN